jgi:hypothetical protein
VPEWISPRGHDVAVVWSRRSRDAYAAAAATRGETYAFIDRGLQDTVGWGALGLGGLSKEAIAFLVRREDAAEARQWMPPWIAGDPLPEP